MTPEQLVRRAELAARLVDPGPSGPALTDAEREELQALETQAARELPSAERQLELDEEARRQADLDKAAEVAREVARTVGPPLLQMLLEFLRGLFRRGA